MQFVTNRTEPGIGRILILQLGKAHFVPVITSVAALGRRFAAILLPFYSALNDLRKATGNESGGDGHHSDGCDNNEEVDDSSKSVVFDQWVVACQVYASVDEGIEKVGEAVAHGAVHFIGCKLLLSLPYS